MATRLDLTGLNYLWNKIKAKFATKDTATTSSPGLMSASDKVKLDGLDTLGFYIDAQGYICQRIGSDT